MVLKPSHTHTLTTQKHLYFFCFFIPLFIRLCYIHQLLFSFSMRVKTVHKSPSMKTHASTCFMSSSIWPHKSRLNSYSYDHPSIQHPLFTFPKPCNLKPCLTSLTFMWRLYLNSIQQLYYSTHSKVSLNSHSIHTQELTHSTYTLLSTSLYLLSNQEEENI